jgi:outer membrane protein OmpA-like peptidoglycan-associated protein/Tol biopolymer transport system component
MLSPLRLLLLLVILPIPADRLTAQEKPSTTSKKAMETYNHALQDYSARNFESAERFLEEAIRADSAFIDAYLLLAEVEQDWGKPLKAIDAYNRGLKINEQYYPYGFIRLGRLQYEEARYAEGLRSYNHFLQLHTGNVKNEEKAKDGIVRCTFSIDAVKHPVDFKPENLGNAVNSTLDDYWPSLSADEQTLVITRLIKSEDFFKKVQEDFFISHWTNNGWSEAKNLGYPINTSDNEGAQTLSGDGRLMVFTACNRSDGLGRCDLYWSIRRGDKWSVPQNMGRPINTAYRETQPSISADGRTLYFAGDRPGGKGNHDIWVSYKDSADHWTVPENLGDSINSPGTEMSPFIHPDNQSLYFSSDGLIGLGGYDIFVSRRNKEGKWRKAVNLGYPINTNRDEIGLIVNARGDKAYFASNIDKKQGKDIFSFDMPVQDRPSMTTYMKGRVMDAVNNNLLRARFELIDLENGKEFYKSYSDSITGEFVVSIPVDHNYMLNVSRKGYLFYSENFSLKGIVHQDAPLLKDVPLQPIEIGKSIVLKNVFYETDSYALKKESEIELSKVVQFLKVNPGIRIEISGYTDNVGETAYNQVLSENRAKTVAKYLIAASVNAQRIVFKGYGMGNPVISNDTEEGRAQNRRTELKIIK